ncbi:MAG: hypothetical protein ACREGR_02360, partial [Minisyncoccia bacterium]
VCDYGDFPDVDIDFLPEVRDYLKNEWAIKEFGQPYVCSIGSYNTFGIKSSLQSMARVFSAPRDEITEITTSLESKDDEGKELTWHKALELYPDLKEYCESNPELTDAARRLLHRNMSMGKHAGGLIISSKPLDRLVPLVLSKDGQVTSAWVEGLHGQDLGPMGLIKFDLLVITNILQIAYACKLVKERHGLRSISGLMDDKGCLIGTDFSDLDYLDDHKAIQYANAANLKCIFQFDSPGIRTLVGKGGVASFEDLVAYTALYRPGPLGMKMHDQFVGRKKGEIKYERHPVLEPILGDTYYVQTYQEQVMQMLHSVGLIPLDECEIIRKAISKKDTAKFEKPREQFIENGKMVLGYSAEQVIQLFKEIESFAAYGFNRSHACAYTYVSSRLLYLKAHFPIEFFAAMLRFEDQAEKIKDYREEAVSHGVKVNALDINKSKVYFDITDDNIYVGYANLDGIGEAVAKTVVEKQPYDDLHSFLDGFGTQAKVLSALLGLRVFNKDRDDDEETTRLHKYYAWYKDRKEKVEARRKRYENGIADMKEEIRELLPEERKHLADLCDLEALAQFWGGDGVEIEDDESPEAKVKEIVGKYIKKRDRYFGGVDKDKIDPKDFNPDEWTIDKEETLDICRSREKGEQAFYGFLWTHPLERSPDFKDGHTLERVRQYAGMKLESHTAPYVQVQIHSVQRRESTRTPGLYYWLLDSEDARGEKAQIQVWADDWERFSEDFTPSKKDVCLRELQVVPPDPRWPSRF